MERKYKITSLNAKAPGESPGGFCPFDNFFPKILFRYFKQAQNKNISTPVLNSRVNFLIILIAYGQFSIIHKRADLQFTLPVSSLCPAFQKN
jgi:hypothetical protein